MGTEWLTFGWLRGQYKNIPESGCCKKICINLFRIIGTHKTSTATGGLPWNWKKRESKCKKSWWQIPSWQQSPNRQVERSTGKFKVSPIVLWPWNSVVVEFDWCPDKRNCCNTQRKAYFKQKNRIEYLLIYRIICNSCPCQVSFDIYMCSLPCGLGRLRTNYRTADIAYFCCYSPLWYVGRISIHFHNHSSS